MKTKPAKQTKIGLFEWRGIHQKWCCDASTLSSRVSVNIDSHDIQESEIEEVIRIDCISETIFPAAMKKAKKELRSYGASASDMKLIGIVISETLYPNGFAVSYQYPESVWPDGELTVVFQGDKPDYCHSDD